MKNGNIFTRILNNNKALAVASIIIAAIIWVFISVEKSPETTAVIKNIPIEIGGESLETLGLESYGDNGLSASVTVRGRNYIVEDKNISSKIAVAADTSSVVTPGNYTLRLDARSLDSRSDFEIVSVEPSTLSVYFDVPVNEREFIIEPFIQSDGAIIESGYEAGSAIIDSASAKVKVSGPVSEVNKITKIIANVKIDSPLSRNGSFDTEFTPVTADGSTLNYVTFNRDTKVTVKIPVYKIETVDTAADYTNRPSEYINNPGFSTVIKPSRVKVGLNSNVADSAGSLIVKTVDFSLLKPGVNEFTVTAEEVEKANSCIILDNVGEFNVKITVDGMEQKTLPAPASISFDSSGGSVVPAAVIPDFDSVEVVGPASVVEKMTADDIHLVADLSKIKEGDTGFITVPVVCENNDTYWIYGEYTANAEIK